MPTSPPPDSASTPPELSQPELSPHTLPPGEPSTEPAMEIPLDRPRKLLSSLVFGLLVLVVAAVLVVLFVRFTASLRLAMALVLFMLTYMGLMAYFVTNRSDEGN